MIYEVFRQERKGQAFAHAGSVEAPDLAFADDYAREQFGRRGESTALCFFTTFGLARRRIVTNGVPAIVAISA